MDASQDVFCAFCGQFEETTPIEPFWQHLHKVLKKEAEMWVVVWCTVIWYVWWVRNKCGFTESVFDRKLVMQNIHAYQVSTFLLLNGCLTWLCVCLLHGMDNENLR
ncbi:hypothetical protein AAZV13_16G063900 [Glycine max]